MSSSKNDGHGGDNASPMIMFNVDLLIFFEKKIRNALVFQFIALTGELIFLPKLRDKRFSLCFAQICCTDQHSSRRMAAETLMEKQVVEEEEKEEEEEEEEVDVEMGWSKRYFQPYQR